MGKKFTWLKYNKETKAAYCTACNKDVTANVAHLKRHASTLQHSQNIKKAKNTPNLEKFGVRPKDTNLELKVRTAEYKIVMFLQEHNLPFNIMEHVPQFLQSIAPDSR